MGKKQFQCAFGPTRVAVTDIGCFSPWWTSWEPVTVCLNGKQAFSRVCEDYSSQGVIFATRCPGNSTKNVDCNWIWSNWSEWLMCSTNCGLGDTTRTRSCNSTDKSYCESFTELRTQTTECEIRKCDINWSTWSEWTECYTNCGEKTRSRTCTSKDNLCSMNEEFESLNCSEENDSSKCFDRTNSSFVIVFAPVLSAGIILLACIFCYLKYRQKISIMCACLKSENNGKAVNDEYNEYTEYCRNQQRQGTIADTKINKKVNTEIYSNSFYEVYNER